MNSTTHNEKRQIAKCIHQAGATRVLEIGAFRGETTRVIADAVANYGGRVTVIDPMRWSSEVLRNGVARHLVRSMPRALSMLEAALTAASYESAFWSNVGGAHRQSIDLYRALSSDPDLLQSSDAALAEFDLVFIDGDHSYQGAKLDLELWGRRVRAGGQILVHDAVGRFPGVVRALDEWERDPCVEIAWPTRDSLCIVHVLDDLRSSVGRSHAA